MPWWWGGENGARGHPPPPPPPPPDDFFFFFFFSSSFFFFIYLFICFVLFVYFFFFFFACQLRAQSCTLMMIIPLIHYDNFATHFFQVTVPFLHPPPLFFFCLSAKRSVLYVDDEKTSGLYYLHVHWIPTPFIGAWLQFC